MGFRLYIFILTFFLVAPSAIHAQVRSIVFPVQGESSFRDDFLDPRGGGTRQHLATDIFADKHTPVVAAVDGVISYIPMTEPSWGYMITIQDQDGYQYRYIHLNNDTPGTDDGRGGTQHAYAPGLKRGSEVRAGQLLGWMGDSGNAENTLPHLHFEIRNPSRVAINPYQSLLQAAPAGTQTTEAPQIVHEDVGEAGVEEGAEFIFTIEIQEGSQGFAIRELQSRLKDAGHFNHSSLTNYFGPVTKSALQSYQRANGIAPTGVLDFQTRSLLNNDPVSSSGALRLEKELFEGDSDQAVLQVELKLETLGYFSDEPDEKFDSVTRESVRRFQRENNLSTTGYINFATWNKLNDLYKAAPKPVAVTPSGAGPTTVSSSGTLSVGSRGSDVVALQDRLRELGHFSPNVISTGYYGSITRDAVISFQRANGIDPVGFVGPQTRAALNAGNTSTQTELVESTPPPETTTPSNTSHIFVTTLQIGSRGNDVVALQDKLRNLGHFSPNVISTGYFGPVTNEAVVSFQRSQGIDPIGIVGPQTRAALNTL